MKRMAAARDSCMSSKNGSTTALHSVRMPFADATIFVLATADENKEE